MLFVGLWAINLAIVRQQLVQVFLFVALDPSSDIFEPFEPLEAVLLQLATNEYMSAVFSAAL